jgi:hypothetical protein
MLGRDTFLIRPVNFQVTDAVFAPNNVGGSLDAPSATFEMIAPWESCAVKWPSILRRTAGDY